MKLRNLIVPALRDVLGRQAVAGGAAGVAVGADSGLLQLAAALVLLANVVADLVFELRKRRELEAAKPAPVAGDAR